MYAHFADPGSWRLFPGVGETLDALDTRGIRTGLLSNWDERLLDLLDGLGVRHRLDPAVVSCEVGVEKPDAAIFIEALRRAGVVPERAVMVGDEPEADVEGARAARLDAVLIDRRGRGDGAVPTVPRLTGLIGLLDRGEVGGRTP